MIRLVSHKSSLTVSLLHTHTPCLMQLLVSPMVSTGVYSNQIEELLQLYEIYSVEGLMTLEQFGTVAKTLLLMIYQNAYPGVVSQMDRGIELYL